MKVASFFPMFGYVSPEPDSGKSTALTVTNALSFNSMKKGKRTPADILNKIDASSEKITIALDELDKVFAHGKDNADLISLFNLGYEWNNIIGRCKRFKEGENETNAYCPKVFAALSMATIPPDTKTRCLFIPMRPKSPGDNVEEDIDYAELAKVQGDNLEWSLKPEIIEQQTEIELTDIDFLTNRNRQLWRLMLAVAKVVGDGWYERGLAAARFFTERQDSEKGLYHKIMVAVYRTIHDPMNLEDAIHSETLETKLQEEFGLPKYVDKNYIAKCFKDYDPDIRSEQVKIGGVNRNGYRNYRFENVWKAYKIDKEVEAVDRVDPVEVTKVKLAAATFSDSPMGSTSSTYPTYF
jgi:hypothetical protein